MLFASKVAVFPLIINIGIGRLTGNETRAFQTGSQVLSLIPSTIGTYLRAAYLSSASEKVANNVSIGFLTLLSNPNISIGEFVYIGAQCNIGSCDIGEDCLIGSGIHILSGKNQHNFERLDVPIRLQGGKLTKIRIGRNCWIGNNSTIMANIGNNSIVAAGSLVVDDVPENCIVGGNPAKIIKERYQR